MPIDLSSLTVEEVLLVALALAVVDTISGIAGALATHTLDVSRLAEWVTTHVLQRVLPIVALVAIAAALPQGPGADAVRATAVAALASYLAETVSSIASNVPRS
jgi:uncharacterized membrane protein YdjX (TVP38/TMEM64 family)